MNKRAELANWGSRINVVLREQGLLNANGTLGSERDALPVVVEVALDGLLETSGELNGLLKICKAASNREPLSEVVLDAAHLMAREVCLALEEPRGA
ncbi:hypothetical protein [Rhizobium sp. BK251]|uniref:hypothetical protein n=1 Tax=Rhizobium sp. BK251 TaxID=2512125 RepID=UPI00104FEC61|nr:hypothetical protein [Rhizobium sp. BK251]